MTPAKPISATSTEGPIVKLVVPTGLAKRSCYVTVTYEGQKSTLKGGLQIT